MWKYHVFAQKLTWYFTEVYRIKEVFHTYNDILKNLAEEVTLYLGHFCAYLIIRWKYKLEYDNQADHGGLRVRKTKTGEQDLVVHQVTKHHKTKEQIHLQTGEQAVVRKYPDWFWINGCDIC